MLVFVPSPHRPSSRHCASGGRRRRRCRHCWSWAGWYVRVDRVGSLRGGSWFESNRGCFQPAGPPNPPNGPRSTFPLLARIPVHVRVHAIGWAWAQGGAFDRDEKLRERGGALLILLLAFGDGLATSNLDTTHDDPPPTCSAQIHSPSDRNRYIPQASHWRSSATGSRCQGLDRRVVRTSIQHSSVHHHATTSRSRASNNNKRKRRRAEGAYVSLLDKGHHCDPPTFTAAGRSGSGLKRPRRALLMASISQGSPRGYRCCLFALASTAAAAGAAAAGGGNRSTTTPLRRSSIHISAFQPPSLPITAQPCRRLLTPSFACGGGMMDDPFSLRTPVPVDPLPTALRVKHADQLVLMGSCFSDNIGCV